MRMIGSSFLLLLLTLLLQGSISYELRIESRIPSKNAVFRRSAVVDNDSLLVALAGDLRGGSDYYRADNPEGQDGYDDRYSSERYDGDGPARPYENRYREQDYDDREYRDSEKVRVPLPSFILWKDIRTIQTFASLSAQLPFLAFFRPIDAKFT